MNLAIVWTVIILNYYLSINQKDMSNIKELRAAIIIALLSNPNHTPHIVKSDISIAKDEKVIDESTLSIAKALIMLVEMDNTQLAELINVSKQLMKDLKTEIEREP